MLDFFLFLLGALSSLLRLFLRAAFLDELSPTHTLMFSKPVVSRLWLPIHSSFDISKEWWSCPAKTIAAPHMLAMQVHLIMEIVVYRDIKPSYLVDIPHDLLKLATMPTFSEASGWVSKEEESVDHLVQQGLFQLVSCAILQKWSR